MSLHPKESGGRQELLGDFSSLVATFAGRVYGMRPAEARSRLLAEPGQCPKVAGGEPQAQERGQHRRPDRIRPRCDPGRYRREIR